MEAMTLDDELMGLDEIFDNIVVKEEKDINIFDMFICKQIQEE